MRVQASGAFEGLQGSIAYDATQLTVRRVSRAGSAGRALLEVNSGVPGTLRFAVANSKPLRNGVVLRIDFNVANRTGPVPAIQLLDATLSAE